MRPTATVWAEAYTATLQTIRLATEYPEVSPNQAVYRCVGYAKDVHDMVSIVVLNLNTTPSMLSTQEHVELAVTEKVNVCLKEHGSAVDRAVMAGQPDNSGGDAYTWFILHDGPLLWGNGTITQELVEHAIERTKHDKES